MADAPDSKSDALGMGVQVSPPAPIDKCTCTYYWHSVFDHDENCPVSEWIRTYHPGILGDNMENADVTKLADVSDLKSGGTEIREGSSPSVGTNSIDGIVLCSECQLPEGCVMCPHSDQNVGNNVCSKECAEQYPACEYVEITSEKSDGEFV